MLVKEIERIGIPAVLVTTMVPIAKTVGANRIVQGIAITSPLGNPRISPSEEKTLRKAMVESVLRLLTDEMKD